ncbi:MAG: tRNA (adenosine(37)-N6)-threonylcarbamoyltransferase complex dimerization subunit type 1 TsaB [Rhodobacteraceae bacterium]|nr:tRNA (adenosine(37)-N6)-threonylcarbamoyltransferase complex dimerization subunit type 1 TsaB [Paracoccaceae bacterium]
MDLGAGPVLAFDTSGPCCAVALLLGATHVERCEDLGRGQAERLFPLVEDVLAETCTAWADLAGIGVGSGPGNFTGIRIAVAAARGLSLALGRPAVGVSRLEAQALDLPRPVVSTVAAPRGALYLQTFDAAGSSQPVMLTSEDIATARLPATAAVTGDAADRIAAVTGGPVAPPVFPLAVAIARIARQRLGQPAMRPAPLYLRPADAAPSRDAAPRLIG